MLWDLVRVLVIFMQKIQYFMSFLILVIFGIQFFSFFPVKGVLNDDIEKLHFKPVSLQTLFCLLLIVSNLIEYVLLLTLVPLTGIQSVAFVVFYTVSIVAAFKFIRLAQRWKDIIRFISKHEKPFLRYPYKQVSKMSLRSRIRLMSFSVLAISGVEHGLVVISNILAIQMKIEKCNMTELANFGRIFIKDTKNHWLLLWDYHPVQIPLFEYINYSITYCWNFVDIMVMIMSIMVAYRFNQIYDRVISSKGSGMATFMYPQKFWKEIRSHYMDVQRILQKINEEIAFFTVLSLGNSIYFICLQFYNSSL